MKEDDPMGTLLDFNTASPVQEKPDHSRNGRERIERIRLEANANALAILHHLLPGGKICGSEFEAGNVTGAPGSSFGFSLRPDKFGVWSDFATGQTGGDIIDLWKACKKCDFKTAIEQIERYLHLIPLRNPDGQSRNYATRTDRAEKKGRDLGPPTNTWYYHDASGNIIAKVTRYDPEPGDKEFRPWDCKTHKCTHPSPRPLYNLPGILNEKRIVLVEGEKCADALKSLGIPATTAMGGSHAPPDRTDWTALKGKEVVIWRDNDTPGIKYAENSCKAIEAVGGTVKILPLPARASRQSGTQRTQYPKGSTSGVL